MTFRLPLLLYVMAVLAAFLAVSREFGIVGFLMWYLGALYVHSQPSRITNEIAIVMGICCSVLFFSIAFGRNHLFTRTNAISVLILYALILMPIYWRPREQIDDNTRDDERETDTL
ncbi:MAG: hypothetical protein KDA42_09450 [Planctomycetales bacterium]|nr:hypothetical protein [Planctomycetales bacterium]